jgi:hypothetical protein
MSHDPNKSTEPTPGDIALPDTGDALPPLDFTTFVLSLAHSALMTLGEVAGPDGQGHVDLPLARQTIDLIGLLQEKTRGNLTGEEERLLDQVVVDLKMKFVEVAGRHKR